ncbi:hypothetical protein QM646_03815 [Rhodococcus erythropolis]|nr:hypothetical protein [Rhodococcus erythropolis]
MSQTVEKVTSVPELSATQRISPPSGKREPLKVSVYERMSKSAAQLMPIFPYDDAGALVPCGAIMSGGPEKEHGHFFHGNTVSEVVVTFGSNEAMLQSGQIMATQKFHGVNSFLKDEKNPDGFVLVTVTQHQSEEAGQKEAMVAKCQSCKKEIIRHEYDAAPEGAPDFDPTRFGNADDVFRQFSTTVGSSEFADLRNSDEGRVCEHCGHVNTPLQTDPWGWFRLVEQTRIANAAYHALASVAQEEGK